MTKTKVGDDRLREIAANVAGNRSIGNCLARCELSALLSEVSHYRSSETDTFVPADISDEGLITDNDPHLTIETLLPTSHRAFCVKCGEHVECDGTECPRCGFDTVINDADETED